MNSNWYIITRKPIVYSDVLSFSLMSFSQALIQDTTSCLVVMSLKVPLGCDNFSEFPSFWWPWQFWGRLVRYYSACSTIEICLIFFFWLNWGDGFGGSWDPGGRAGPELLSGRNLRDVSGGDLAEGKWWLCHVWKLAVWLAGLEQTAFLEEEGERPGERGRGEGDTLFLGLCPSFVWLTFQSQVWQHLLRQVPPSYQAKTRLDRLDPLVSRSFSPMCFLKKPEIHIK